jgi:hypothetical protein
MLQRVCSHHAQKPIHAILQRDLVFQRPPSHLRPFVQIWRHHLSPQSKGEYLYCQENGEIVPRHIPALSARPQRTIHRPHREYRLGRLHHQTSTFHIPAHRSHPCTPSTSLMGTCFTRWSYDGRLHMGDSTSPGACRPPPASHIIEIVYSSRTFTRPCLPIILLLL